MKGVLQSFIVLNIATVLLACTQKQEPVEMNALSAYEGTYVGFSPSLGSAIGVGEVEITIKGELVFFRLATGKVLLWPHRYPLPNLR